MAAPVRHQCTPLRIKKIASVSRCSPMVHHVRGIVCHRLSPSATAASVLTEDNTVKEARKGGVVLSVNVRDDDDDIER